jgi:uncharacterized alpha-E superfamily protein
MLSRIAESLYWIGRYVERAEDTARILDVHFHLLVEDRNAEAADSYRTLLSAMGLPPIDDAGGTSIVTMLIRNRGFDGSIASSINAAWDNARGAREVIPSELWECLNVARSNVAIWEHGIATPHETLRWVKDRAAIAAGIVDTTMSRDDCWRFLVMGRSIERADMTVRLLSARYGERWGAAGWRVLLRSCSAHESFLRRYHGSFEPAMALGFLLADPDFPRSVLFALREAQTCVAELDAALGTDRHGSEAHRTLARAAAELTYASVPELSAELGTRLDRLERTCAAAHDAVTRHYFRTRAPIEWSA